MQSEDIPALVDFGHCPKHKQQLQIIEDGVSELRCNLYTMFFISIPTQYISFVVLTHSTSAIGVLAWLRHSVEDSNTRY